MLFLILQTFFSLQILVMLKTILDAILVTYELCVFLLDFSSRFTVDIVVSDTQSDSIQFLNFAKKLFIQYSIQYCFAQDSIQNIIQFKKNSADSIQKIIQFISQGIIDTGRMGKVPKNYLKNVQNRLKKGLFIKNGKYRFKIWFIHSFHDKIQFKGLFNIIFFQEYSIQKNIQ